MSVYIGVSFILNTFIVKIHITKTRTADKPYQISMCNRLNNEKLFVNSIEKIKILNIFTTNNKAKENNRDKILFPGFIGVIRFRTYNKK